MKKSILFTLTLIICSSLSIAQEKSTKISKVISVDELTSVTQLVVKNINGPLDIVGYDGNEILIEGTRQLWKEQGSISDSDAEDYQLKTIVRDDNLLIYIDAPGVEIDFEDDRIHYNMQWKNNDKIHFKYELKLKIPRNYNIDASTINGGDLLVESMDAKIEAYNVNGSVKVIDATSYTEAYSVNGDIEVWFAKSPTLDMDFHTVNGTIEIYSPEDFGAIITFESLHGDLFTDFKNVMRLPHQLNKAESSSNTRYKISSNAPIQIGEGGPAMNFKLVNGSAFIRVRES